VEFKKSATWCRNPDGFLLLLVVVFFFFFFFSSREAFR
jgi:hypothetical protein